MQWRADVNVELMIYLFVAFYCGYDIKESSIDLGVTNILNIAVYPQQETKLQKERKLWKRDWQPLLWQQQWHFRHLEVSMYLQMRQNQIRNLLNWDWFSTVMHLQEETSFLKMNFTMLFSKIWILILQLNFCRGGQILVFLQCWHQERTLQLNTLFRILIGIRRGI